MSWKKNKIKCLLKQNEECVCTVECSKLNAYKQGRSNLIKEVKDKIEPLHFDDFLKTITDYQYGYNQGLDAVLSIIEELED